MDYSLNLRKMSVGAMKGKELFIASPVCQKQRISFEKPCERTGRKILPAVRRILQPYSINFVRYSTNFVRRVI